MAAALPGSGVLKRSNTREFPVIVRPRKAVLMLKNLPSPLSFSILARELASQSKIENPKPDRPAQYHSEISSELTLSILGSVLAGE